MFNLKLSNKEKIIFFVILGWIAFYFALIIGYSVNIPMKDDYGNGLLLSVIQLHQAHHIGDFFRILIELHNEHRLGVIRLIGYLQYLVCGELNFRILIFIANLIKLGLFILLIRLLPRLNMWGYLVITLFFFQLSDSEAALWTMAALSIYSVFLLALITLIFINKSDKWHYFILACVFSILTVFADGNGMLVLFTALLALFFKKQPLKFFIYLLLSAVLLYCYFHGYKSPFPSIIGFHSITYFLAFLGSAYGSIFNGIYAMVFCGVFGAILLFFSLRLIRVGQKSTVVYFIIFIILTAIMATVARGRFGTIQALSSRYSIYSIVLCCILYSFFIDKIWRKYQKIINICIILLSMLCLSQGVLAMRQQKWALENSLNSCSGNFQNWAYPNKEFADEVLNEARLAQVYNIKNNFQKKCG